MLDLVLLLVVFLNFLIGIFVISQDWKSSKSRLFFILSMTAGLWTLTNFLTGSYPTPFWLMSTYAMGALVMAVGAVWVKLITDGHLNRSFLSSILLGGGLFFFLSYLPGFLVKSYDEIYLGGAFLGTPGLGMQVYTVYFLVLSLYLAYKLINAYVNAKTKEQKILFRYLSFGILITLIVSALTSFILPSLSIFSFSGLDSIGFLFFLIAIAYSTTKLNLFNIRVFTTELFTFALWIFLLIKVILASSNVDRFVNAIIFVLTVVFGIYLIRSVLKEIEAREVVEKLANDLQIANDRLHKINMLKTEFVSLATHQLRSPLTAIKGYVSMLLEGSYGNVEERMREPLERISNSTGTLAQVVQDFLDVSRIEQGSMKYDMKAFSFKDLVEEVTNEQEPNIKKSGLEFSSNVEEDGETQGGYIVYGDRLKLKQVVTNLIDNAVKYTKEGYLKVKLSHNNKKVILEISDSGIGIDEKTLPALFQKFERADGADEVNVQGTGLGLYIARQIVEAHDGVITAHSNGLGKGSMFKVELKHKEF